MGERRDSWRRGWLAGRDAAVRVREVERQRLGRLGDIRAQWACIVVEDTIATLDPPGAPRRRQPASISHWGMFP